MKNNVNIINSEKLRHSINTKENINNSSNSDSNTNNQYVYDIQLRKNHYFPANGIYTHNCRLRNSIEDQLNEFSYTLGAGGVMTGSLNVITLNLNTIAQRGLSLREVLSKVYKFQFAFRSLYEDYNKAGLLPAYRAHYIDMKKQFLTIGINGIVETAEFFGLDISVNEEYQNFVNKVLQTISKMNTEARKKYNCKFNTEMVPGENLGLKQAKWEAETKIQLFEVIDDSGKTVKYPLNTKVLMKNSDIKLIQDLKEDDTKNIEKIIKYSSFLD